MLIVTLALVSHSRSRQFPGEHVQIPETEAGEVDFTACTVCHTDKTSGAVVHPAVELGCEACHAVDQDADYTEVYLPTEGNDLCFTCHGDKQAQPSQLWVHQPVRRGQCVTCHDPHTSETPALLKKATDSLEPEENLCLGCHTNIVDQIQKSNPHAAVALGCATCHTTHSFEPADTDAGRFHLSSAPPDLCLLCHDADDDTLRTAHSGQPFGTARCTECHNPHGSDNAKLINNYVHGAFLMGCETCHEQPQEGKVVLQEGARREMCLICHSDVEEQIQQASVVHFPLEMDGGCVGCHSPHAATYEKQLREGPVRTCMLCHTERLEERAGKQFLHRPVFEFGCTVCHLPHTSPRERLLRTDLKDLCLECHGRQILRQIRTQQTISLFDGAFEFPTAVFAGLQALPVTAGSSADRGHPVAHHPFAGTHTLNEGPRAGKEFTLTCANCHTPHASGNSPKFFVTDTKGSMEVCVQCH